MIERLRRALAAPTDTAGLVAFRVVLGALVTVGAIRFLAYGWVDELFVRPKFFFTYYGFSWVKPLPGHGMHAVFALLAVLGVAFSAGFAFRVVAPILFVLFAYVELVDVTNWLNHYYLVGLLLLLASFMPLGRAYSVDAWLRPATRLDAFPAWCTWLLRFQVGTVYFFAGLAKLSTDWLVHAQPLDIWLASRTDAPVIGALFGARWVAYAFSWGGFLFDTTIPLWLSWRRTRPFAYLVVIAFHATVGALFPIGMFPFIMVSAAAVFFSPSWPRRLIRSARYAASRLRSSRALSSIATDDPRSTGLRPLELPARGSAALPRWALCVMTAFCIVQVGVPLRAHLYGGNVLWHEQGMRFSWRVMCREKNGAITYVVESKERARTVYVSPRRYLTDRQERELSSQPDLVLQLAHHVADDFRARGWTDARVRVEALVSLNGRPAVPMIDPQVDLAAIPDGFAKASWIAPEPNGPPIQSRPAWNGARVAQR
jgi:hypothetical protein